MKNPFVMMALMAAAMSEAFRENAYRKAGMAMPAGRGSSRGPAGKAQPAGTKLILRFYKAKHGIKAKSTEEALEWYRTYDPQPKATAVLRRAPRLPVKLAA